MDNLDRIVIETSERSKSNTHRIEEVRARVEKLAEEHEAIHSLAISVEKIAINTTAIQKELTKQGAKIEALERVPADRWNSIIKTIITAIASAIAGGIIALFIGG